MVLAIYRLHIKDTRASTRDGIFWFSSVPTALSSYIVLRASIVEPLNKNLFVATFLELLKFGSYAGVSFGGKRVPDRKSGCSMLESPRAVAAQVLLNMK